MDSKKKFKIGINETIVDKPIDHSSVNPAINWHNLDLTSKEFLKHIKQGHAFSAHYKENYRKTQNFICSDFVAADIDGNFTIQEAIEFPFIKKCGSFLYTTPNHSNEKHRFRVVFLLENTIVKSESWSNCLLGLAVRLGSDQSIKDAGRMFYGNSKAKINIFGNLLAKKDVEDLISIGKDARSRRSNQSIISFPRQSAIHVDGNQLVKTSDGKLITFRDLTAKTSVFCPFHLDTHHSAFVVKSFKGSTGIHCMSCNSTYWETEPERYDFTAFDRLIEERRSIDLDRMKEPRRSSNYLEQFFPPEPSVEIIQKRYLPRIGYTPGITMVKSPKGSGKTEALRALLSQIRAREFTKGLPKKDQPKSILLIGHRQTLIREAANKLGLACYLDPYDYPEMIKGFATSLDSLNKLTDRATLQNNSKFGGPSKIINYDLIILDESEQIFSHLIGDTIKNNGGNYSAFIALNSVIKRAKSVFALDADIGLITAHGLKSMRPDDWKDNCRIIFNKPVDVKKRRVMSMYQSKKDLEHRLIEELKDNKRCFVVSNSKQTVDTLEEMIVKECGSKILRRKITSDNSNLKEEKEFVLNITKEYLNIQVLLCSPSLGTGIDITFPENSQEVDHVFGFFYPYINTHTDIDQQLSRVRNPKEISVWFDRSRFNFETEFDVIRHDLASGYFVESAILGNNEDGSVRYNEEHPLLLIWTHVVCSQRASKNKIVDLFSRLRKDNGWDIKFIEELRENKKKKSRSVEASKSIKERRIDGILNADDLNDVDVMDLYENKRKGDKLSKKEVFQLERGILRMTFNVPITKELIEKSLSGRLQDQVKRFKILYDPIFDYLISNTIDNVIKNKKLRLKKVSIEALSANMMYLSGLYSNGMINEESLITNDDLKNFIQVCKNNRTLIEELSGTQLRDDLEINPIRQLNFFLGVVGLKVVLKKRNRDEGIPIRKYGIDEKGLKLMRDLLSTYKEFSPSKSFRKSSKKVSVSRVTVDSSLFSIENQ